MHTRGDLHIHKHVRFACSNSRVIACDVRHCHKRASFEFVIQSRLQCLEIELQTCRVF
jgi:hypothetical protein